MDLTVAICSNRINNVDTHVRAFISELGALCGVMILLDKGADRSQFGTVEDLEAIQNVELISGDASGLSNLRNIALERCVTKYILFIDDDVFVSSEAIKALYEGLKKGSSVVGLGLKSQAGTNLNRWYITENQYHYLGVHARNNKTSVWGACMAFDLALIKKNNLVFRRDLSRHGKLLLSGEDTAFISDVRGHGGSVLFLESHTAIHHVNEARLELRTFARRVLWQGVTESVRQNMGKGFAKELRRNFSVVTSVRDTLVGVLWSAVVLVGIAYGCVYRRANTLKTVLFVCTGNYYRSRFAEIYFNHLASSRGLRWRALSRGLWIDNHINKGNMAEFLSRELVDMQILYSKERMPTVLTLADISQADKVIGMNEVEHRSMVEKSFFKQRKLFSYWHVFDQQDVSPTQAFPLMREMVERLIDDLGR